MGDHPMTIAEATELHLSTLNGFARDNGGGTPAFAEDLRRRGSNAFGAKGFPSTRDEQWRFTSVQPIARTPFALGPAVDASLEVETFGFNQQALAELVFVNGRFSPGLSRLDRLPRGVIVSPLKQAMIAHAELVEPHLGRLAVPEQGTPFAALNAGFLHDGAFVHVRRGTTIQGAIHLLFVSRAGDSPTVSHPRTLIVVEENAEVQIVETYAGRGGVYWTNPVTEIVAGPEARIDHCKLQQESLQAYHTATMQVHMQRRTSFVSHAATIGGKLTRNDLACTLAGEGGYATLNGLVLIGDDQHCDNHTLLDHQAPNCPSHELYKHVLDGKSTCVFKGQIHVANAAQKTDSKQTSKTLLLSSSATMQSMPALEIYADDVKCTHGSTIGPVDEDMTFYLCTRGVSREAARHLLTYAFAADVTRRMRVEPVRRRIEDFMAAQHGLPQDLRITDAAAHDEDVLG
jgi:Fe-S cluster assembly protein SufD